MDLLTPRGLQIYGTCLPKTAETTCFDILNEHSRVLWTIVHSIDLSIPLKFEDYSPARRRRRPQSHTAFVNTTASIIDKTLKM